ncbi:MAG: ABC transporter permease [Saprospiraceae bacterium]|nr:ABC transporter permease [Saprospiraceae bacterium]
MLNRIYHMMVKDIQVELRQGYAIAGIFLFAATTVFIVFKSFNKFTALEWSLLLWIIVLFAGVNAIVKSFVQEGRETGMYYYTIFDPLELIISKYLYNFLLLSLLFITITVLMIVFGGSPIKDVGLFIKGSLLGVIGISAVFTLVSGIAGAGSNISTLMSILALPLVLPILLTLIRVTAVASRLIKDTEINDDLYLLAGMDGILIGVGILLFPIIWKS